MSLASSWALQGMWRRASIAAAPALNVDPSGCPAGCDAPRHGRGDFASTRLFGRSTHHLRFCRV